jgi:hypothetical protein
MKFSFTLLLSSFLFIQNVDTSKVFEVVCQFNLTVDGQPETIKITISSGEDPTGNHSVPLAVD